MTTMPASTPLDGSFTIQDRRRTGFFTIDNELLDRYGSRLKAHGLAVYMTLARFANQEKTCWPSLATIAKRTGMSRVQVIRELKNLQALHLIQIEHQQSTNGEYRTNLYVLLELPGVVTEGDMPGHRQLPPLVTVCDHPSHRQLPKQDLENKTYKSNKTQKTTRAYNNTSSVSTTSYQAVGGAASTTLETGSCLPSKTNHHTPPDKPTPPPSSAEPLAPALEGRPSGAEALIAVGMTAKVAERLAERYSLARLEEKLNYLDFLQAHAPNQVKNPCGWLRKAIEDDFAAPDGYRAWAEQAEPSADELVLDALDLDDLEIAPAATPAKPPTRAETLVPPLQAQYGTTATDRALWQRLLVELQARQRSYLSDLLQEAGILRFTDNRAQIWVQDTSHQNRLQHPQIQVMLSRLLTQVAGRSMVPAFVPLPAQDD